MTQNFSMDDIAKLLQATQKPPRKKKILTEEQTIKMKERLAMMREKSLQARQAKASKPIVISHDIPVQIPSLEIKKLNEKDTDELFEKKYNSRFEKLDETVGHIKTSLEEMREAKKQKALERQKAKEEKQIEKPVEIKQVEHVQQVVSSKPNPLVIPKVPDYKNMFKKYPY
tara:strand:+ start:188 stop:700 length:513 start_codon:yes stop_codon:yes gene_type:complete